MDRNDFEDCYNNIIFPYMKFFCAKEIHKIRYSTNQERLLEILYKNYTFYENLYKSRYMKHSAKKLDRHKVAACLTGAIIRTQPIDFRVGTTKLESGQLFVNEIVAFYCSLKHLQGCLAEDIFTKNLGKNVDDYAKSVLNKTPDYSLKFNGLDKLSIQALIIHNLSQCKPKLDFGFDVLAYSTVYYYMERELIKYFSLYDYFASNKESVLFDW